MRPETDGQSNKLLVPDDPHPLEFINETSAREIVLICEHAGRSIPKSLDDLGLSDEDLHRHIAYDIGAKQVATMMAEQLNAPLVLQNYSRLVIDCNRPVYAEDVIPERSDATEIPGNFNLDAESRQHRIDEIYTPFHDAVSALLDQNQRSTVLAIHSFTPVLNHETRPWDLAFLYRKDTKTSQALADAVRQIDPNCNIGMNKPYTIEDSTDWFVPYHGEGRGLAHSLIEIRNDHLDTEENCRYWVALLSEAIEQFLKQNIQ